jgi:alanine racemase
MIAPHHDSISKVLANHDAFVAAGAKAIDQHGCYPLLVGIRKDALVGNVRRICQRIAPRTLCAVMKGDAYGHGVQLIVPHLIPFCSRAAFVDNCEAAAIRAAAPEIKLLRLRVGTTTEIAGAMRAGWNVCETIGSHEKAQEINEVGAHTDTLINVHVSLDAAGLGRNGLPMHDESELHKIFLSLLGMTHVRVASVGCHFPDAADSNAADTSDATRNALERFVALVRGMRPRFDEFGRPPPEISAYSSASSCAFGASGVIERLGLHCFDRIGNSLFGLTSTAKHPEDGTRQVMHAATTVCDRIFRRRGSTIGYEHAYVVSDRDGLHVALLGIGWSSVGRYYQGLGKTDRPAYVMNSCGGIHRLLGRQSMNIMTIEASDEAGRGLKSGDIVYLTTDYGESVEAPTVSRLSVLMGGVQTEFITSLFGGSPSSLRFVF